MFIIIVIIIITPRKKADDKINNKHKKSIAICSGQCDIFLCCCAAFCAIHLNLLNLMLNDVVVNEEENKKEKNQ